MTRLSDLLKSRNTEGWSAREVGRRVEAAGYSMSQGTATALFGGRHHRRPDDATPEGLANVLPVTMAELREAIEIPVEPGDPWVAPEAARYLTQDQREAPHTAHLRHGARSQAGRRAAERLRV